jgi:hypothetical protein
VPGVGLSAPLPLDNMSLQHHPAMMAGSRRHHAYIRIHPRRSERGRYCSSK